jgi:hypothetical protein
MECINKLNIFSKNCEKINFESLFKTEYINNLINKLENELASLSLSG